MNDCHKLYVLWLSDFEIIIGWKYGLPNGEVKICVWRRGNGSSKQRPLLVANHTFTQETNTGRLWDLQTKNFERI